MINEWDIYWITRLDSFQTLFTVGIVISSLAFAISVIGHLLSHEYPRNDEAISFTKKAMKITLPLVFVFAFARPFIPSTKEGVAIKVIPAITNSEFVQKELPELYQIAKDWLKEELERMKKDREREEEREKNRHR